MNTLFTLCRTRFFAVALFALLFGIGSARGQSVEMEDCSGGRLYYLAFPDTVTNAWDTRFPSQLIISNTKSFAFYLYSPVDQQVTIGRANGTSETITITAGDIYHYEASQKYIPLVTAINTPQTNVLKLEAEYPVIVYGYILTPFGAEAYTAIPVEGWGKEYYAAAWPGEVVQDVIPDPTIHTQYNTVAKEGGGELLIIAGYDNTQVQISPNIGLADCAGCTQVTLQSGEAYLVQSSVDTSIGAGSQPDMAGTLIQASKPIGVVSGNTRLMHNGGDHAALAENSFKNLAMEWLPPVEQHGTEFVFTPTLDDRYQRQGLDPSESRDAENVRVLGTRIGQGEKITAGWYADTGVVVSGVIGSGEFVEEKITTPVARGFTTSGPAYAYASPNAVVKFNGTTTWGQNPIGSSYLSWSTFMVELVAREQWTSFAPVRTPSLPTQMSHYLNLVTDTANVVNVYYITGNRVGQRTLFPFNKGKIAGTDLVWGSIRLNAGVDYFIEGENGARFTGHVYGSYRGQEQYRPGGTRKDEGKGVDVSGREGDDVPSVLHPGEYEEDVALMYGYPLAPSRCVLGRPGIYTVQTETDCGTMTVRIVGSGNEDMAGLRSITLYPDSSENVRLEFVSPAGPEELINRREATVRLVAINPDRDAVGLLIIKDGSRDGQPIHVRYSYVAERVRIEPHNSLEFSDTRPNETSEERRVTIINTRPSTITLRRLSFMFGNQGFRIKRTEPSFDWSSGSDAIELGLEDSLTVWLDITPQDSGRIYHDSLRIESECNTVSYPVLALPAEGVKFCLVVNDLDFGVVEVDRSKTMDLQLCNRGSADITFNDPWVTWLGNDFGIPPEDIDKLKGKTLREGECVTIRVIFSAGDMGTFRTVARFWANTRDCRDTSIWSVRVVDDITGVAGDESLAGYGLRSVSPNPVTGEGWIDFRLGRSGVTVVEVYNGAGERVAVLANEDMESGDHRVVWDAKSVAAGAYHIRIRSGEWSSSTPVIVVK